MAEQPKTSETENATQTNEPKAKRGRPSRADRFIPEALRKPYTPEGEGNLYHYGVMRGSPLHQVTAGQIQFQRDTYVPDDTGGNEHQRHNGIVSRLTAEQVKRAENAVGAFVMKVSYDDEGNVVRAHAEDTRWRHYRREETDEPLAYHVFMTPMEEYDGYSRPSPKPLLERE